jgi:hypothetical protein
MKLGLDKRWFVMPSAPVVSRNLYFFLPTFVGGFALGIVTGIFVMLDPHNDKVAPWQHLVFILWGLGFVFSYFEPAWLSPTWYVWLKKELGVLLPFFAREAQELGRREWLRRSATQDSLEEWVRDFKQRFPF